MKEDGRIPQINISKIAVDGGIAGAIFTVASMLIFLIGIPILRFLFPAAIVLGGVVALILRFRRKETPGAPWLLAGTVSERKEKSTANPGILSHRLSSI
jgi:hypothetical protein